MAGRYEFIFLKQVTLSMLGQRMATKIPLMTRMGRVNWVSGVHFVRVWVPCGSIIKHGTSHVEWLAGREARIPRGVSQRGGSWL